jgi:DNA-binding transcriptional MocR family regulator
MADELGLSRNTVLNAYEQLLAEGYLEELKGEELKKGSNT